MDTLDYIFGPMDSWSTSETFGESQPVIVVGDEPAGVFDQGLPARRTGSSRFGSDFLANSPSRRMIPGGETSRRARPWMSPR